MAEATNIAKNIGNAVGSVLEVPGKILDRAKEFSENKVGGFFKAVGSIIFGVPLAMASIAMFGVTYAAFEFASAAFAHVQKTGFKKEIKEDDPFINTVRDGLWGIMAGAVNFAFYPYVKAGEKVLDATSMASNRSGMEIPPQDPEAPEVILAKHSKVPPFPTSQDLMEYQENVTDLIAKGELHGPGTWPEDPEGHRVMNEAELAEWRRLHGMGHSSPAA